MKCIGKVVNKFLHKSHKRERICELEKEFNDLKQEILFLKTNPESGSYLEVKDKLEHNYRERNELLMG